LALPKPKTPKVLYTPQLVSGSSPNFYHRFRVPAVWKSFGNLKNFKGLEKELNFVISLK
jgi:hypothetical protein